MSLVSYVTFKSFKFVLKAHLLNRKYLRNKERFCRKEQHWSWTYLYSRTGTSQTGQTTSFSTTSCLCCPANKTQEISGVIPSAQAIKLTVIFTAIVDMLHRLGLLALMINSAVFKLICRLQKTTSCRVSLCFKCKLVGPLFT